MSGFVVGCGRVDREIFDTAFERIKHRGPYVSGIFHADEIVMAQNYLQADGAGDENEHVPVMSSSKTDLRICYDGQIGNGKELASVYGIPEGVFTEERLLLFLYQKHGLEMFDHLDDAIFTLAFSDGKNLFAARDVLGIKTLFYGWKDDTLYLASELKSIVTVTEDVYEFPPGHFMDSSGKLTSFQELPKNSPDELEAEPERMAHDVCGIVRESFNNRVGFRSPTASLLSGGIDSSVIACLASEAFRKIHFSIFPSSVGICLYLGGMARA